MFTSGLTIDSDNFIPKNIYAPINETAIIDPTTIIINILKEKYIGEKIQKNVLKDLNLLVIILLK